jgi:predicted transglutaminase-like protease
MAGFAIKQYHKDRKRGPKAFNGALKKKKTEKYFNCGKEGYFAKEYRSLKTNTAKSKKPRKRPAAKANMAEPSKYKLLS